MISKRGHRLETLYSRADSSKPSWRRQRNRQCRRGLLSCNLDEAASEALLLHLTGKV